jgi:hypothetical protein
MIRACARGHHRAGERPDIRNSERPTIGISSVVALNNVPSVLVLISATVHQNDGIARLRPAPS